SREISQDLPSRTNDVGYKRPPGGPFISHIIGPGREILADFPASPVQLLGRVPVNPTSLPPDRVDG
ncbi:MAG: hypothetical protein QOH87_3001, partial [Trebonia sp.]|nr:hypothetical protein [Trebonia sp.]